MTKPLNKVEKTKRASYRVAKRQIIALCKHINKIFKER